MVKKGVLKIYLVGTLRFIDASLSFTLHTFIKLPLSLLERRCLALQHLRVSLYLCQLFGSLLHDLLKLRHKDAVPVSGSLGSHLCVDWLNFANFLLLSKAENKFIIRYQSS